MWRGMLGDFDADAYLKKPSSVIVFVLFQVAVVVLCVTQLSELLWPLLVPCIISFSHFADKRMSQDDESHHCDHGRESGVFVT